MVELIVYGDPHRLLLARVAAEYLAKPDQDNRKRPLQLLRRGHFSIFRHVHVTCQFRTSLIVRDHLFRYTTAAMAAAGLRINEAEGIVPPVLDSPPAKQAVEATEWMTLGAYHRLRDAGIRMQDARYAAPCGVEVSYIMTFNFLTLMQAVFPQRLWEPGAQAETHQTVQDLWEVVRVQDPELWEAAREKLGPEAIRWEKARWRLRQKSPDLYQSILKETSMQSLWDSAGESPQS